MERIACRQCFESGRTMLIRTIEKFLREQDMPATTFGRLAARDPRFVLDLRMGREPRPATRSRMEHFMNKYREACREEQS